MSPPEEMVMRNTQKNLFILSTSLQDSLMDWKWLIACTADEMALQI